MGYSGHWFNVSAGAVINHIVDHKADAKMRRTFKRPLPTGRLSQTTAIGVALLWFILGTTILLWKTNPLTTWLTFLAMIYYAFIYTLFLKRTIPQNIVWGGAAGAVPLLLGWVAMTGAVTVEAVVLFLFPFLLADHFYI